MSNNDASPPDLRAQLERAVNLSKATHNFTLSRNDLMTLLGMPMYGVKQDSMQVEQHMIIVEQYAAACVLFEDDPELIAEAAHLVRDHLKHLLKE
jgi:hypothetical protein